MTHVIITWVVVALLLYLAGRLPLDQTLVQVGRAIVIVVLVLWTLRVLNLLP